MRERVMGGRGGQLLAAALGVAMCLGVASRADAGPIAKDSFVTGAGNYADGTPLNGQGPANTADRIGWSGDWSGATGDGATTYSVVGTGLDYGSVTYETGGAVSLAASSGSGSIARSITGTPSASTYYFSVMMANLGVDSYIGPGDRALAHFAYGDDIEESGLAFGFWGDNASTMDAVFRYDDKDTGMTNVNLAKLATDGSDLGKVFYFVAKAEVGGSGSTLSVWLNPTDVSSEAAATDSADASALDLSASGTAFADLIEKLILDYRNEIDNFAHTYNIDEVRFASGDDGWAAVTGGGSAQLLGVIAEPAGLGLLVLALVIIRKRRH
jgi:hypothetical protein